MFAVALGTQAGIVNLNKFILLERIETACARQLELSLPFTCQSAYVWRPWATA
jgi:hypothetical protein